MKEQTGRVVLSGARVIPVPPPLYYVAAFLVGRGLERRWEWAIGGEWIDVLGWALLAAGVLLTLWAVVGVVVNRTTIVPHRPVAVLLTRGAYGVSRNPMYAGLAVAYLGLTLVTGSWWPLTTLLLAIIAIRLLVIGPEEAYLASRYPERFDDYRSRVRRWF